MKVMMFQKNHLLILCWIYISGSYGQNDTLDVAVVEDNLPDGAMEIPSMPANLNMTINLFQNSSNVVDLKLNMNEAMNEQRSIYVIKMNKTGHPFLKKQSIPIQGNIAFYQDQDTGANVMVTCDGFSSGRCDPTLEGSFYVKNVEYGLEPLALDSPLRRKRSLYGSGKRGKLYSVFRRTQEKPVKDDFDPAPTSNSQGESMKLVNRVVDLREFLNPVSSSMEMRRRIHNVDTYRPRRPRKPINNALYPYEMGLVVIADFSVYQRWYRNSKKETAEEKDIDAKLRLRQYLAHVINGVDLRFKNLRTNRMRVVVSRFIISDSPEASPWTENRFKAKPLDLLYADDALNKLITWRYTMAYDLPIHDHTILFTGHDIYRPSIANKGVAGFARVRSMCSHASVSVVEEHGGFSSILTATHELGHSLGAYHDGHNNTCVGEDNFIMTPIGGSATPSNALNPFHFSECSEEAFQNFLTSLPKDNCLTDETDMLEEDEFQENIQQQAGQIYGPNEQCRQHLGDISYYAWGGILGEAEEICTHMACKNAMSETSFNIYYAARGTSCGNKKWCIDGLCTYSDQAPAREEICVHGDSWRRFGNQSCAAYVGADPSRCYFSYYSRFCCTTCGKLRKKYSECEYGNRKKVCDIVDKKASLCYHDDNEKMCCGSCRKHNTGMKGCEYGDKESDCDHRKCGGIEYDAKCCSTCAKDKQNVRSTVRPGLSTSKSNYQTIKSDTSNTLLMGRTDESISPSMSPNTREANTRNTHHLGQPVLGLRKNNRKRLSSKHKRGRKSKYGKHAKGTSNHLTRDTTSRFLRRPYSKLHSQLVLPSDASPVAQFRRPPASTARGQWQQRKLQQNKRRNKDRFLRHRNTSSNRFEKKKSSKRSHPSNAFSTVRHNEQWLQTTPFPERADTVTTYKPFSLHIAASLHVPSRRCVKPGASFMTIDCDILSKVVKEMCFNPILGSICCGPCESSSLQRPQCIDRIGCKAKTGAHCYNDTMRSKCCATCKRFETEYSDCRYGNRDHHCVLFMRYMPAYTCKTFQKECCMSCKNAKQ